MSKPTEIDRNTSDETICEGLYKSPYEFKGKRSERERQAKEEPIAETDSEDEESRLKKKHRFTKKNGKRVIKTWEEPSALTYATVEKELDEDPFGQKEHVQTRWKSKAYIGRSSCDG